MKFQGEKRVSHVHSDSAIHIVSSRCTVAFVHTYYVPQRDDGGLGIMYSTLLSATRRVNVFTELQ